MVSWVEDSMPLDANGLDWSYLVEIRGLDFAAEASDVAEAEIVCEDNEEVGAFLLSHSGWQLWDNWRYLEDFSIVCALKEAKNKVLLEQGTNCPVKKPESSWEVEIDSN
ncbi:uncharacterized protein BDR25DRAFT_319218 [Lindgomyces ingoldianus]|uniref:Uncharacterized protein n=1 Tax=Lindgomyces ingoldianus TaxID=673940 RepID=A0ACB6QCB1_9PLEO|nr:uncharacterized protein BDR25DRAFT_319218 [Lindgomyces ingoldianus]KAF2464490.1 hypothetical protein BDR25DRAFT_319218 [Lindgomyces ingoldianus]